MPGIIVNEKQLTMKKNMGTIDRTVRILVALVVLYLYFTERITGTTAIVALVASGIFILTGFVSFCPLYLPFGLSTRKREG